MTFPTHPIDAEAVLVAPVRPRSRSIAVLAGTALILAGIIGGALALILQPAPRCTPHLVLWRP